MKQSIGIARRIDDLGRIVIPKEIRSALKIKEGDPLEIFTTLEGEIVLKPFEPNEMQENEVLEYFDNLGEDEKKKLLIKLMNNL